MMEQAHKHKYQAYASATQTIAKTKQIILLYDGVIRLVQQAKEAIIERRIEDRYHLLTKASSVIHGLQGCLDFENGKEIANVLYSFYSSIDMRIFSIHRDNNTSVCDGIINDLKQMRDAWIVVDGSVAVDAVPVAADMGMASAVSAEVSSSPLVQATTVILSA